MNITESAIQLAKYVSERTSITEGEAMPVIDPSTADDPQFWSLVMALKNAVEATHTTRHNRQPRHSGLNREQIDAMLADQKFEDACVEFADGFGIPASEVAGFLARAMHHASR